MDRPALRLLGSMKTGLPRMPSSGALSWTRTRCTKLSPAALWAGPPQPGSTAGGDTQRTSQSVEARRPPTSDALPLRPSLSLAYLAALLWSTRRRVSCVEKPWLCAHRRGWSTRDSDLAPTLQRDFARLPNVVMSPHRGGGVGIPEIEEARMEHLASLLIALAEGSRNVPGWVDLEKGY